MRLNCQESLLHSYQWQMMRIGDIVKEVATKVFLVYMIPKQLRSCTLWYVEIHFELANHRKSSSLFFEIVSAILKLF